MKSTGRLPRTIPCRLAALLPMRRSSSWTATGSLQSPARWRDRHRLPCSGRRVFRRRGEDGSGVLHLLRPRAHPAALPHRRYGPLHPGGAPRLRRPVRRSDQAHGLPDRAGEDPAAANSLPEITGCACLYDTAKNRIVLFCTVQDGVTKASLRKALREKLSTYMIPSKIEILPSCPAMPTAKRTESCCARYYRNTERSQYHGRITGSSAGYPRRHRL